MSIRRLIASLLNMQALGFQSAINPGRMIRVLHTLVRTLLITLRVRLFHLSLIPSRPFVQHRANA